MYICKILDCKKKKKKKIKSKYTNVQIFIKTTYTTGP